MVRYGYLVGWSIVIPLLITVPSHGFQVVIDPGHGGFDTGAVNGPARESKVVLQVAHRLRDRLAAEPGMEVHLTRTGDEAVSLPERLRRASHWSADLFLSLHANSEPGRRARGMELFFLNSLPPDEDALYLANLENQTEQPDDIAKRDDSRRGDVAAIVSDLRRQSRILAGLSFARGLSRVVRREPQARIAVKQAPLFVLAKAAMPSVLVEIGFISHPTESRRLMAADFQDNLAEQISEAVLQYRRRAGAVGESPSLRPR